MADISQIEVNGTTYDICDATARDSLDNYLPLTGGTLSDHLTIENGYLRTKWDNFDMKKTDNGTSSSLWNGLGYVFDKNDLRSSYIGTTVSTNGNITTGMFAYNYDSSGEQVGGANSFYITKRKDGTNAYYVADKGAFRSDMGIVVNRTYVLGETLTHPGSGTPKRMLSITLPVGLNLLNWGWYAQGTTSAQNVQFGWSDSATAPSSMPLTLTSSVQAPIGLMNSSQYHTEFTCYYTSSQKTMYLYGAHAGTGSLNLRCACYVTNISFGTQS